jgi:hypothetical protein
VGEFWRTGNPLEQHEYFSQPQMEGAANIKFRWKQILVQLKIFQPSEITLYPQGTFVLVHYVPLKPNTAVFETKAAGSAILFVLGILFMVIRLAASLG